MTDPATERYPRPSQVTVAGWSMLVGAGLLVPSIFDAMSRLRSVETRRVLEEGLASGSARGLGIDVERAIDLLRVGLMIGGAAAATLAILGWFVLRGDRSARIGATVAVFPLFAGGLFAGGFLTAIVAAGVAMLWTGPARDWFAGRKPRQPRLPQARPAQAPDPVAREGEADPAVRVTAPVSPAPPMQGYGAPQQPFPHPQPAQPPPWPPYQQQVPWPHPQPGRPAPVQTACLLTWVFSGITAGFALLLMLSLVADPTRVVDVFQQAFEDLGRDVDRGVVLPALWGVGALLVLWSGGAAMLAGFVWRRQPWARVALLVCTVLAGLVSVLAFPVSVLHLAATAWVVGMLLSPLTRAWFREESPADR